MRSGGVLEIVLVEVLIEIDPGFVQTLVILGSGQRSQHVELH
jgi:hypothetical protein